MIQKIQREKTEKLFLELGAVVCQIIFYSFKNNRKQR